MFGRVKSTKLKHNEFEINIKKKKLTLFILFTHVKLLCELLVFNIVILNCGITQVTGVLSFIVCVMSQMFSIDESPQFSLLIHIIILI